MKKIMFIALPLVALGTILSLMAFRSESNMAAANNYILIEIYEVPAYPDKGIHIHYGNSKREIVPFKSMNVEDHDEAGDLILSTINRFVAEGYQIESSAGGLAQSGMITKVFMRKK